MELSLGLAFAAGFISFISPCVLPLVPAYITYMGGRVTNTVAAQAVAGGGQVNNQPKTLTRISTGLHSVFFVFGFSLVFVGLGLIGNAMLQQIAAADISATKNIIARAGGIVIIVFGLHFMGALTWLFQQVRERDRWLNIGTTLGAVIVVGALTYWAFDRPPSIFRENIISLRRILSMSGSVHL